ncbi:MAG: membrane protein insertion efficiency factor YidD [Deltaproteobacteria bacterium]
MKKTVILFISVYQRTVSVLLPNSCRFFPSCSAYAKGAIANHGIMRGFFHALLRLSRCHPWNPGGWDPVP